MLECEVKEARAMPFQSVQPSYLEYTCHTAGTQYLLNSSMLY